jgi:hypothetical protein
MTRQGATMRQVGKVLGVTHERVRQLREQIEAIHGPIAADLHGDEVEHGRLTRTSPRQVFSLPAFHGQSEAFREMADFYVIYQLDIGIGISVGLAGLDAKKADPKRIIPLRVLARRFIVWRDAWQRLCDDYGIDWPAYRSLYPDSATMRHLEELAPRLAFSPKCGEVVPGGAV